MAYLKSIIECWENNTEKSHNFLTIDFRLGNNLLNNTLNDNQIGAVSGKAFFIYLDKTGYCTIKDERTTPNVIVSSIFLNVLSGSVATSATDNAPRIPPIIITCLHVLGHFSRVNL